MIKSSKSRPFYGYAIVLFTFIVVVIAEGMIFSFGIFFDPLLRQLAANRATISGAFSLMSIVTIPVILLCGRLTDRFGPRQVLTACGLFFGLGYILLAQTHVLWQLYVFYGVVTSVAVGLYWVPVLSLVPRWFNDGRGTMMGIICAGVGTGQLIFPLVINWLTASFGWRTAMVVTGSVSMAIIMLSAQFLRRSPQEMGLQPFGQETVIRDDNQNNQQYTARESLRTPQFWMVAGLFFAWQFYLSFVVVHSVIYGLKLPMTEAQAAGILVIIGGVGIAGRLLFGRLADKLGMKAVLLFSQILTTFSFVFLLFAHEVSTVYIFAVIFGLSYGTFELLQSNIQAELFGIKSLGTISGISLAFGSAGFAVGSVLAGYIYDIKASYSLAIIACGVFAFLSIILYVLLPLKKRKRDVKMIR